MTAFTVLDVPVLTDMSGNPARALAGDTTWRLEDREDSTNRLTLTVPLADVAGVVPDAEVLFQRRRFKIIEVNRRRQPGSAEVVADEAQVELAGVVPAAYKLNGARLSAALTKALAGTGWVSGGVFNDDGSYYADFENEPVNRLLRFLQSQSKQWIRFDSVNRKVFLTEDKPAPLDRVFTYGAGVSDIEKRATAPEVTVIEPTGRGGMTITNVNGGSPIVEDFGWYTGLGIPLAEARKRFTKKQFWADDRYVYAMNLLRDAQKKLAELAYPQINYKITGDPGTADGVRLGDQVWVVDEELGVKLATRVVRLVTSNNRSQNQIELDYLPRSFGSIRTGADGDSTDPGVDQVQFQVKNEAQITLGQSPVRVLESTVQVIADTAFQVGVTVRVQTFAAGEIGGYFLLDGVRLDPEIQQTAVAGWHTFGLPFLVTQVTEGSKNFDFYMTVSSGVAVVPVRHAEMFIVTRAALGGLDNSRPDRSVADHIGRWFHDLPGPTDSVTVDVRPPIGDVIAEQIGEWFEEISAPVDVGVAMFRPEFSVTGTTISLWQMIPGQVFTIRVESGEERVGEDSFQADAAGEYVLNLGAEFNLPAGTYSGVIVEFGQSFNFTVEVGF